MRFAVVFLVFANLLLFGYARDYFGARVSPDSARLKAQIRSDEVRVLARKKPPMEALVKESSEQEASPDMALGSASVTPAESVTPVAPSTAPVVPTAPVAPVAPPPVAPAPLAPAATGAPPPVQTASSGESSRNTLACLVLSTPSLEVAEQISAQASRAGLTVTPRSEGAWWVFIPPLSNRQVAIRKAEELRSLGVTEFFILNEGPQQFAISLGVFSRVETAEAYRAKLREKGVRSARVGPRLTEKSRPLLEIQGDAFALVTLRISLPTDVSSKDCP